VTPCDLRSLFYPFTLRLVFQDFLDCREYQCVGSFDVIPRFKEIEPKPPYVCPGCSNHAHGNNMINR
jgi:hypothetical protein